MAIGIESCIQTDPLDKYTTDDSRVYISNYDKKINFKDYQTYFLPDTVFIISNDRVRLSNRASDKTFIQIFKANFEKYQYQSIAKHKNPDLGIIVSRVSNSKIGSEAPHNVDFNSYWGFPIFDDLGFEYPGYYDNYEINDSIWNIEVVDLKNALKNQKLNVIWNVQIRGNDVFEEDNFSFIQEKIFEISSFL
ncbi:MAG: DUF4136 domain-containing protein [Bacteroidota bacterium]